MTYKVFPSFAKIHDRKDAVTHTTCKHIAIMCTHKMRNKVHRFIISVLDFFWRIHHKHTQLTLNF